MKTKLLTMGLIALAVGLLLFAGCEVEKESSEPAAKSCPAGCTKPCCAAKDAEAKACPADCTKPCCAAKTAEAAVEGAVAEVTTEQTMCPVMKAPINKDLFIEYQGKKVYFCCPGCEDTFKKDPAKYVKDLPQFKE